MGPRRLHWPSITPYFGWMTGYPLLNFIVRNCLIAID
ncbi:hypothetical protein CGRA01v4_01838 [Colletotrichum graminicola]|nr:hypothetical protein CGRA01v4_01838 [Colletotrichum graminicola]